MFLMALNQIRRMRCEVAYQIRAAVFQQFRIHGGALRPFGMSIIVFASRVRGIAAGFISSPCAAHSCAIATASGSARRKQYVFKRCSGGFAIQPHHISAGRGSGLRCFIELPHHSTSLKRVCFIFRIEVEKFPCLSHFRIKRRGDIQFLACDRMRQDDAPRMQMQHIRQFRQFFQ